MKIYNHESGVQIVKVNSESAKVAFNHGFKVYLSISTVPKEQCFPFSDTYKEFEEVVAGFKRCWETEEIECHIDLRILDSGLHNPDHLKLIDNLKAMHRRLKHKYGETFKKTDITEEEFERLYDLKTENNAAYWRQFSKM